jgi:hypothetical protein
VSNDLVRSDVINGGLAPRGVVIVMEPPVGRARWWVVWVRWDDDRKCVGRVSFIDAPA